MTRDIYKGYMLKSVFCKKHNIKISVFNKTLLEKGFLIHHVISECCFTGKKKYGIGINLNTETGIKPLHGSNQQGTFQYRENFLKKIFEVEDIPFNPSEYKITFGCYKNRKISSMVTKKEIDYCRWVMDYHFTYLLDHEKLVSEKYLAFKWFWDNKI
jgi:hypothetical protein